jgi:hypothetical protein
MPAPRSPDAHPQAPDDRLGTDDDGPASSRFGSGLVMTPGKIDAVERLAHFRNGFGGGNPLIWLERKEF